MGYTTQDVWNLALTMLAQPSTFIASGLPSGGGQNDQYTITPTIQAILWMIEGQNRLGRLCTPIPDTVNYSGAAGQPATGPYSAMSSASGRPLYRPTQMAIGSAILAATNTGYLRGPYSWYPNDPATGNPTAWADNDTVALIGSGVYATTPTFTINGYFLPQPVKYLFSGATVATATLSVATGPIGNNPAAGDIIYLSGGSVTPGNYTVASVTNSTTLVLTTNPGNSSGNVNGASPLDAFLDDFRFRALGYYVAWETAQKNMYNQRLAQQIAPCANEWIGSVKEIYDRVIENDPTLAGIFAPEPIDAQIQLIKQMFPRT
jgi:hypothetical protein